MQFPQSRTLDIKNPQSLRYFSYLFFQNIHVIIYFKLIPNIRKVIRIVQRAPLYSSKIHRCTRRTWTSYLRPLSKCPCQPPRRMPHRWRRAAAHGGTRPLSSRRASVGVSPWWAWCYECLASHSHWSGSGLH